MRKRILLLLLSVSILISLFSVSVTAHVVPYCDTYFKKLYKKGELNKLNEEAPDLVIGDTNFDGAINAIDALYILEICVQGGAIVHDLRGQEEFYVWYFSKYNVNFPKAREYRMAVQYYAPNAEILGDTNNNYVSDAGDALQILQYAVGKRSEFTRQDMEPGDQGFAYYVWPSDWYAGMYYELTAFEYDQMMYYKGEKTW